MVHAFSPMQSVVGFGDAPPQVPKAYAQGIGNEALTEAVTELHALGLDRSLVPTFTEEGDTYPVISAACDRWEPDLLVMGTHGRSPLTELFLGTTAARALGEARCDVLVKRVN
ncbi:universal stress protein [Microvirga roseola]|uniref:universal stress protein n=1 Tax=Microvirga roseola TaxID=2883126 RepID=UPI001E6211F1|nr:universal stress protein [Microvirga roseola]